MHISEHFEPMGSSLKTGGSSRRPRPLGSQDGFANSSDNALVEGDKPSNMVEVSNPSVQHGDKQCVQYLDELS